MDQIATKFCWADFSIMRIIIKRVQGNAKKWMDTRHDITTSWKETKTIMMNIFSKPLPFSKMLKEAVMHCAKPGQYLAN